MSIITKLLIAALFVMFVVPMAGIVMLRAAATYKMASYFEQMEEYIYGMPVRKRYSKGNNGQRNYFKRPSR